MRHYFQEGDLISVGLLQLPQHIIHQYPYSFPVPLTSLPHPPPSSQAEVQQVYSDGSLSLHTRSLKYGKVRIKSTDWCE